VKSIMSNDKSCYVCGRETNLHKHHIFGGANRKISERYGCWVYLCAYHHNMSYEGVHFNRDLDLKLKESCQMIWEQRFEGRSEFRRIFGKSWI